MAKSADNNTTPESSDSEGLSPASEPMIVDGKVVYGEPTAKEEQPDLVESEIVKEGGPDYVETPEPTPRNGMAQAGMFLGVASFLMNPFALTSIAAIVISVVGIRRAISLFRETGLTVGRWPATIGLALGSATAIFAIYIFVAQPTVD